MADERTIIVVTNIKETETSVTPDNLTTIIPTTNTTAILTASPLGVAVSGPQGIQGVVGATGATGATGSIGVTGAAGISGYGYTAATVIGDYLFISQVDPNGVIGSPYSIGFIRGNTGSTGATGEIGATGATGATGSTGDPGATGATGATGDPGIKGITGATGATGATGINGISGYGYTAAGVVGDYLFISQVDPNGVIGSPYSIGFVRGNTGPTGPVGTYVRTLEGVSGDIDLRSGNGIKITTGITFITIASNLTSVSQLEFNISGAPGQAVSTEPLGSDLIIKIAAAAAGVSGVAYFDATDFNTGTGGFVSLKNAVKSFGGCTGDVGITGTTNEIEVIKTCPDIVIGLPDVVNINNLTVSNITATIDGGIF